ncbi:zinc finger protein 629-like [Lethenteron reissneri]|uniref:zinc finger protein 629-like n=1 Tax=Lethenteron reissneri TaxID=7753 RepID=UPI002AB7471B|nr:zinc finger protein 629-like [Lethenteron reissneri]
MACTVASPLLEPSGNFPAWLKAQGVNAKVARAMNSELGIRDYGVLRACVRDGLVRAELLATARDRLPFGFYAVLRQVVKDLQDAEPHDDAGTPCRDDAAASSPSDVTLGGLVDVLLALFNGLSRELLLSLQRLGDVNNWQSVAAPLSTAAVTSEDVEGKMDHVEYGEQHLCVGLPQLVIQNVTSISNLGRNLTCAANDGPYAPQQTAAETHSEEFAAAAASVDEETSRSLAQRDTTRRRMSAIYSQMLSADEEESNKLEINKPNPVVLPWPKCVGNKAHWCELCGKNYSKPYGLKQHLRIHTGEKLHRCEVCRRTFLKLSSLKIHVRSHMGEKPYSCDFCGKCFTSNCRMTTHQRTHTDVKPYCCTVCGYAFKRQDSLVIHFRTHTGEKPYSCRVCGKGFAKGSAMKSHLRTHTGEKPYGCAVCGKRFSKNSSLKNHRFKMACVVAAPVLESSGDFPAWLEAQGVNADVARAMDSELGIRDYGVLRACVGDGLVRAELLATARDRLPFGFYATLRQVVKALQGAEPHDKTPRWDAATTAISSGDVTLRGLVDVLLALFNGLGRELLVCAQRLGAVDGGNITATSHSATDHASPDDLMDDMNHHVEHEEAEETSTRVVEDSSTNLTMQQIKTEPFEEEAEETSTRVVEDSSTNLTMQQIKTEPFEDKAEQTPAHTLDNSSPDQTIDRIKTETRKDERPVEARPGNFAEGVNSVRDDTTDVATTSVGAVARSHSPGPAAVVPLHAQQPSAIRPGDGEASCCKLCGRTFARPCGLTRHQCPHERPHRCDVCELRFSQHTHLESHRRTHTGEKPFGCDACSKRFSHSTNLKNHKRTHTGEKPYACAVCKKAFSQRATLKTHMHTHTGEKPFRCEICNQGFTQNSTLKTHLHVHTGEKPFRCKICNQGFTQSSKLKIHLRLHTGEKPYRCKICNQAFTQSFNLKVHLHTHTGEKPYRCSVCDKAFSQSSTLKTHLRRHAGKSPYQCGVCDREFLLKTHLSAHQQSVHAREGEVLTVQPM